MTHSGEGLCVLTSVVPERVPELQARLGRLPTGEASPFARVGRTHFARFVLIPYLKDSRGDQRSAIGYLVFSSEFDGALERYVAALCDELGPVVRDIWSQCVGYPEQDDRQALASYLLAHRVAPGYSVLAYPGTTVDEVRASLGLSQRLVAFSISARDLGPTELKRAWEETFGEAAR